MKIIENCWSKIAAHECQFGAHVFDGRDAKFYVSHWMTVLNDLLPYFSNVNAEGFVGHCLLVFRNVRTIDIEIYTHIEIDGKVTVNNPSRTVYVGNTFEDTKQFLCAGTYKGFTNSVEIRIEAQSFELHVLEKNEPAKES
jgi:hypothetical protein